MKTMDKLESCLAAVRRKTDFEPQVALVLGSGLGDYGKEVEVETIIPYSEIEGFPVSTAPGHAGRLRLGGVAGGKVAVMLGLPTGAGGVNYTMNPGDLMLLRDQITCFVPSPLIGPNEDKLGVRFPDMSRVYDDELAGIIRTAAAGCGIPLKEGVYCQLTGPQFESPAEIRMLRMLGADAVGMSTAVEAVAARHMGMRVAGVSCISNLACGMTSAPLTSEEVNETAARVADRFTRLVTESIRAMGAVL